MVHNVTVRAQCHFALGAKVDLFKFVQRTEPSAAPLALFRRFFLLHPVANPLVLLDILIASGALGFGQLSLLTGGAYDSVAAPGAQPDRLLDFFKAYRALRIRSALDLATPQLIFHTLLFVLIYRAWRNQGSLLHS